MVLQTYSVELPSFSNLEEYSPRDEVAIEILKMYHPVILIENVPLAVAGDGNCLYRAVSRGLFADEQYHLHIRLLAAIEIGMNSNCYDSNNKTSNHLFKDNRLVHGQFNKVIEETCKPGKWAEILSFSAISAALNIAISSYCPPTVNRNLSVC